MKYLERKMKKSRAERFLDHMEQRAKSDTEVDFVLQKIKQCENPPAVYQLGVQFRKGLVPDYPNPKGTEKAFRAAFECFRCANTQGYEDPKVHHNLGMIFYRWKKYDEAEAFFKAASIMGLSASSQNLKTIRREKEQRERENKKQIDKAREQHWNTERAALRMFDSLLSKESMSSMMQMAMQKAIKQCDLPMDDKTQSFSFVLL